MNTHQPESISSSIFSEWHWVSHPSLLSTIAQFHSYNEDYAICHTIENESINIPISELRSLKVVNEKTSILKSDIKKHSDLQELQMLDRNVILYHLRKRFEMNINYTNIGQILLYIHPFHNNSTYDVLLHGMIEQCLQNMRMKKNRNQTILISGESGTGKSLQALEILKCLININQQNNLKMNINPMLIENEGTNILKAIHILECFGNARTLRNENSSRFSKCVKVIFGTNKMIIGYEFLEYFFDVGRVVDGYPAHEKSFHVLESIRDNIQNRNDCRFLRSSISHSNKSSFSWSITANEMKSLKFKDDEISDCFNILLAVIHLGRLNGEKKNGKEIGFDSNLLLTEVCSLLGLKSSKHENIKIVANGKQLQSSKMNRLLEHIQGMGNIIAKFLYVSLFKFLINKMNGIFAPDSQSQTNICILDMFGSDIFDGKKNGFSQFMKNWTEERLNSIFVKQIFEWQKSVYSTIDCNAFVENEKSLVNNLLLSASKIEQFESPKHGLLSIINKCSKLKSIQQTKEKIEQRLKSEINSEFRLTVNSFVINHFDNQIEYDIENFIKCSNDEIPIALVRVFNRSKNKVLKMSVQLYLDNKPMNSMMKYPSELNELIHSLKDNYLYFVKCLLSNADQKSGEFDCNLVNKQLQSLRLLDTVKIRNSCLPIHMSLQWFIERYSNFFCKKNINNDMKNKCECIINEMYSYDQECNDKKNKRKSIQKKSLILGENVQIGIKHIFLTEKVYDLIEILRERKLEKMFDRLESFMIAVNQRKKYKVIQDMFRMLKNAIKTEDYLAMQKIIDNIQKDDVFADIVNHHLVKQAKEMLKKKNIDTENITDEIVDKSESNDIKLDLKEKNSEFEHNYNLQKKEVKAMNEEMNIEVSKEIKQLRVQLKDIKEQNVKERKGKENNLRIEIKDQIYKELNKLQTKNEQIMKQKEDETRLKFKELNEEINIEVSKEIKQLRVQLKAIKEQNVKERKEKENNLRIEIKDQIHKELNQLQTKNEQIMKQKEDETRLKFKELNEEINQLNIELKANDQQKKKRMKEMEEVLMNKILEKFEEMAAENKELVLRMRTEMENREYIYGNDRMQFYRNLSLLQRKMEVYYVLNEISVDRKLEAEKQVNECFRNRASKFNDDSRSKLEFILEFLFQTQLLQEIANRERAKRTGNEFNQNQIMHQILQCVCNTKMYDTSDEEEEEVQNITLFRKDPL